MSYERRRVRLRTMAEELGVGQSALKKWIAEGLPYTQLGGIVWVEPSEVHAWLDQFKTEQRTTETEE